MKKAFLTVFALLCASLHAQVAPTEANLRAGILTGGLLRFNSAGTIALTTPVIVATDVTVDGAGNLVKIDGQTATSIFIVSPGARLVVKNLTVANGLSQGANATNSTQNGGKGFGGAIQNNGGTVTIVNCAFTNNVAHGGLGYIDPRAPAITVTYGGTAAGGAIWQSSGTLSIDGSAFFGNKALGAEFSRGDSTGDGGAIYALAGAVSVSNSSFSSNLCAAGGLTGTGSAFTGFGGDSRGGAIAVLNGTININQGSFITNGSFAGGNSIGYGGAVYLQSGSLTVSDSFFSGNIASGGSQWSFHGIFPGPGSPGFGGAISAGTNVSSLIASSSLVGNISQGGPRSGNSLYNDGTGYGGGIDNAGSMSVINSTFSANLSTNVGPPDLPATPNDQEGGAIYNTGNVGVTNSTIVANISKTFVLESGGGTMTVKNSLFADNAGTSELTFVDAGNNFSTQAGPAFTASSSQNNAKVNLGALGNYGGSTPTYPLLPGSVAINAADDSVAPATDQRGRARPFGAHADVGSYEVSPPFSIFGKVNGYVNGSTSATLGSTTVTTDAAGKFLIQNVPQGSASIQLTGTNSLFRPNPLVLDVQGDSALEARGFEFKALAYDPDVGTPAFTFAGAASETWEWHLLNAVDEPQFSRLLEGN